MQLDGDARRNALLNSPWVKAVLPIRPGREQDAMQWLQRPEVVGGEGLNEPYPYDPRATRQSMKAKASRRCCLSSRRRSTMSTGSL